MFSFPGPAPLEYKGASPSRLLQDCWRLGGLFGKSSQFPPFALKFCLPRRRTPGGGGTTVQDWKLLLEAWFYLHSPLLYVNLQNTLFLPSPVSKTLQLQQ